MKKLSILSASGSLFAAIIACYTLILLYSKHCIDFSVGIGHIWMASSILVSSLITGRCFTQLFKDSFNENKKEILKKNDNSKYESFSEELLKGALCAKKNATLLTVSTGIYTVLIILMIIFYNKLIQFQLFKYSLLLPTIFSIFISYRIYFTDSNLPGLKEILAKTFDLPVLFSIIIIALVSYLVFFPNNMLEASNLFSSGAIAFQIVLANLSFNSEIYDLNYMFDNY